MREEGAVSSALHAAVALSVAYLAVREPYRLGATIALTFLFAYSSIKLIKCSTARIATAVGYSAADAFWRRPPACGRSSPGFPSAHTANVGALCVFIALATGWHVGCALLPMVLMAAGRLSDQNHTLLQTLAGCCCGPILGFTAHEVALNLGILSVTPPDWWPPVATALLILVPMAYVSIQVSKFCFTHR